MIHDGLTTRQRRNVARVRRALRGHDCFVWNKIKREWKQVGPLQFHANRRALRRAMKLGIANEGPALMTMRGGEG